MIIVEFRTSACRVKRRNLFILHQCCAWKIIEEKYQCKKEAYKEF